MVKITVLGSFNMDLVMRAERRPLAGETLQGDFAMHLGGKGFNQAVAARRLGADVAITGRVGDDEFGRAFLAALDRDGLDRCAVVTDPTAGTGVASIVVEPDGANTILQDPRANRGLTAADVAAPALFDAAAVAMLQLETSMSAAIELARRARAAGATTLLNPAPAAAVPEALLALTDILVPNEIEARTLTGAADHGIDAAFGMAAALLQRGPRAVVLTLGEHGAVLADATQRIHVPRFDVHAVDTVGAGDAFCAALAVRIAEGAPLADAVRFANAAGAVATTRPGAEPSMPHRHEVESLLSRGVPA
ncbi:MAG: ribokinase [Chloroflexi bacterium]|nr:ribokinase [Chloroflexota bacterium]